MQVQITLTQTVEKLSEQYRRVHDWIFHPAHQIYGRLLEAGWNIACQVPANIMRGDARISIVSAVTREEVHANWQP